LKLQKDVGPARKKIGVILRVGILYEEEKKRKKELQAEGERFLRSRELGDFFSDVIVQTGTKPSRREETVFP